MKEELSDSSHFFAGSYRYTYFLMYLANITNVRPFTVANTWHLYFKVMWRTSHDPKCIVLTKRSNMYLHVWNDLMSGIISSTKISLLWNWINTIITLEPIQMYVICANYGNYVDYIQFLSLYFAERQCLQKVSQRFLQNVLQNVLKTFLRVYKLTFLKRFVKTF